MSRLLDQFLAEAQDLLQGIDAGLMQLERTPDDDAAMNALFRCVHTLKGNSGLFDMAEMTRLLHAAEDLMDAVRGGVLPFTPVLADQLLRAADLVSALCDQVAQSGDTHGPRGDEAVAMAATLRALIAPASPEPAAGTSAQSTAPPADQPVDPPADIPAPALAAARDHGGEDPLVFIRYLPSEQCYFSGDDPLRNARQAPGRIWGRIVAPQDWPPLAELDAYCNRLAFELVCAAPHEALSRHFRYVADQVSLIPIPVPAAEAEPGPAAEPSADLASLLADQRATLLEADRPDWHAGRVRAAVGVLAGGARQLGLADLAGRLPALGDAFLDSDDPAALIEAADMLIAQARGAPDAAATGPDTPSAAPPAAAARADEPVAASRSLRVDQARIDRLLNLVGEMAVARNALPYLARHAARLEGGRELEREIKAQHAAISRITDELQGAIMQIRMMPVALVFERFPRLVRDLSRRLGKQIELVLEGEETEADKNIVESIADPLIHMVRNSLDHGLEMPEERIAAGKPATGRIAIRAAQEGDRIRIEIRDDGRGIDPERVRARAVERGLIAPDAAAQLSERDAVQLVFLPGFSTAAAISDLSGRGVGMDVVRTAVERLHGDIALDSVPGRGTTVQIMLPLSVAITRVLVIETDGQRFAVPVDAVVETLRVPETAVQGVGQGQAIVRRGRIVALRPLNDALGIAAAPRRSAAGELAILILQRGDEQIGLIVDDFRETLDVIQKPLGAMLAGIDIYSGSTLMGDGAVVMVLNARRLA
ncbi:chemotaxis protein CheA [Sphingomonas changnyeongensis]|uniref:Chemotaxis protein CheA n=1 Tax=Sphingomonas changnyeongensis TaxID=2698679 RepID=A0A7Z2S8B6_9SPHN|nr:chemotaxis protein CheA [Sphingomonas changnyeongensis]QHL89639.1 chemotaxis protein CheA [Sphingomonas changnyeongensis]